MSLTIKEIRNLADDEIIQRHDETAKHTIEPGVNFYLKELYRRDHMRIAKKMFMLTLVITFLTFIVTIATIINIKSVFTF